MDSLPALNGEQIGSLIYLVLLARVIGGWFFVSQRGNLGKVVQYAAIWGFIFLGAIVAVGLWTDIRQTVTPRQSVMMDGARVEVPQATRRALLPDAGGERRADPLRRGYRRDGPGAEPRPMPRGRGSTRTR
jgi:predicted aspartyl protease